MNRIIEMDEYIYEYRSKRMKTKKADINNNYYAMMIPVLGQKIDLLIEDQIVLQRKGQQAKIKYLYFSRLLSSGYTESYEMALGMSSSKLYLDENTSYIYWNPELIYNNIQKDMQEAESLLRRHFVRLEKYELLYIKQKLLMDDWELFCTFLPELVERIKTRIVDSPLLLDRDFQVLCGNYMDKLELVCYIQS